MLGGISRQVYRRHGRHIGATQQLALGLCAQVDPGVSELGHRAGVTFRRVAGLEGWRLTNAPGTQQTGQQNKFFTSFGLRVWLRVMSSRKPTQIQHHTQQLIIVQNSKNSAVPAAAIQDRKMHPISSSYRAMSLLEIDDPSRPPASAEAAMRRGCASLGDRPM
ncbi:hypothetical protein K432DRAFT_411982 [Lepidopterella palustris CBS 459.81]|uniref:Uncharacterized protein n=1 Tax=Lepidopterella palustris CBS 459.81 TaxID=1314670 RepID=A0A8E2J7K1_9PEZI|nr:hypothetical protein K432DRAFT_411982 [Lepidopterella palustris CBS 459.81]